MMLLKFDQTIDSSILKLCKVKLDSEKKIIKLKLGSRYTYVYKIEMVPFEKINEIHCSINEKKLICIGKIKGIYLCSWKNTLESTKHC